ncbi:hypothetical protein GCM10010260_70120 [Streptomyces filipinensis]|uniref:Uncharacterized protein n=1 Tax=Streptomyces filipinensis TaxID=66887 RepID=A0A918MFC8_9ACTN|nr:hypothetical protein [Streptomyces filipinensis]GGV20043.1 hypothetical protein GCM10010260_70120 [Streptomyces filipinensis]
MNSPTPRTPSGLSRMTDEELAQRAAELATSWVSATSALSQTRGWALVGLQHSGSGHMEMYAWAALETWERQLAEALATAGSDEGCERIARAKEQAVRQMRDLLLDGIRRAEQLYGRREEPHRVDPRARLRDFISRNG